MQEDSTHAKSLAHTKWNCKYHKYLHQSIGAKYFLKKKDYKNK